MSKTRQAPADESVATPPDERGTGEAAKGMSEGDPAALSHYPAREKAIRAASDAVHEQAARVKKARKGTRASKADKPDEAVARRAAAEARLLPELPAVLKALATGDRVTVRRDGAPDPNGKTVVYWMQRAERAFDNPALDCAIHVANALGLPVLGVLRGDLKLSACEPAALRLPERRPARCPGRPAAAQRQLRPEKCATRRSPCDVCGCEGRHCHWR